MTDFDGEEAWGKISLGNAEGDDWGKATDDDWGNICAKGGEEDIGNAWAEAHGVDQQESWGDKITAGSFEEECCDEPDAGSARPASVTRVLEALARYPVLTGVTTALERKDVYALALSCWPIFDALRIDDPISRGSIVSRCIQKCHGPYQWGLPEHVSAPLPDAHQNLEQEGGNMDIKACARQSCWNDVCKHCRQPPPISSELRRRWICSGCLAGRLSENSAIPECSCASVGAIFCLDCSIWMHNDDQNCYDLKEYRNSNCTEAADRSVCKNGERTVYNYACWDCERVGEAPYGGVFICRWCNGRLPYTELIPWDIVPYSSQSCRVRKSGVQGGH